MPGDRNMRKRRLFAASMFAMLASSNVAVAEPIGGNVAPGQGTVSISSASNGSGMTTTIDQTSDKAYIDWTSFNLDAADIVNFNQNTIQSIAVNRVIGGGGASAINGALNAKGHVWILNPAGIAFGGTATVNVGGLLVTTANLDPTTFMSTAVDASGGFTFTSGGNGTASVSNAGTINSGGLLALVAPFVDNSGTLTSSYGDVLLGGAEAFRVSFSEVPRTDGTTFNELLVTDFIINTRVANNTPGTETVPVTNTGSITGANVIATAASVGGGAFINMDGVVEATSVGTQSGDIVLLAGDDFTGGAAKASNDGTDKIRVKNADLTAADDLVMQGTDVSIEKGTGPGKITAGVVQIKATSGDVTSDAEIDTTTGAIDIQAFNLASLSVLDAKTTLDVTAKDIDLAGKLAAVGKITLDATDATKDISGTDIDIEGGSVELSGAVVATDSATIKAATGDVTINDDLTSSGAMTGSVLIEAKSGTATTAGLDATATTASGATIDVTADDVATNGVVRADGAVTLTAETGDLLTHGKVTGASVDMEATLGDVVADDTITSTVDTVVIDAVAGLADLHAVDAKTTLDVTAKDIDLAGKLAAVGKITLDATDATKNISGTDIDIEGGSVELTGPVVATDSATIKAATGDVTINDNLTSSGTTTGSVLIEAKSGKATTAGLDAAATTASGATIDVAADDIETNGVVRADGAVTLTAETGDLLTHDTVTGASVDMEATLGDVVADDTITSTLGAVGIDAVAGLADLHAVDAKTTLDVTAKDINLAGKLAAVGKITLDATDATKNISGTDIDIEGGSVELTGPVVATDSATIKAATGDATLNNDITSTGSVLIEATSGKASVKGVDADTTTAITAEEIDLDGLVNGDTSVTLNATDATKDISGTDIHITGGSVDLTGKVVATDSATIEATTTDVTLNDDLTSTGSVLIKALLGKASVKGVDADTTTAITAKEIDLDGLVNGDTSVTLDATDATKDISGSDINITGGSVELTGKVVATDSATIKALTGDATINNDLSVSGATTGSVLIEAKSGKATMAGLDATATTASGATIDVTADDIETNGAVRADGAVTLTAETGDLLTHDTVTGASVDMEATLGDVVADDAITSTLGAVGIDALAGLADLHAVDAKTTLDVTAKDIDLAGKLAAVGKITLDATDATKNISGADIDIEGGSVELTGPVVATDSATIKAATGDVTIHDDLSSAGTTTGSVLIEAKSGKATTAGLDATATTASGATIDVTADDIVTNGAIRADGAVTLTAETGDLLTHDTVTGASVDMEATLGDVVADDTITSTLGAVGIDAVAGLADLHTVDAKTTLDVTAKDIDLTGKLAAVGKITLDATDATKDISGTDIDIEGGSVELSGPVVATNSATIKAASGDATLNDDITSTGSILIDALLGKASVKGVDATTTAEITAKEIDLDGLVNGDTSVTLDATDATKDISGTDINITGGSVDLTGKVVATDLATIKALTGDATINDDLSVSGATTGAVLIEAKSGKATTAGLDATATTASGATIDMTADDIVTNGAVRADGAVTLTAETGDLLTHGTVTGASVDMEATLGDVVADDTITSTLGAVGINAVTGLADLHAVDAKTTLDVTAKDIDLTGKLAAVDKITLNATDATKNISGTDIDIEGGSVELTGPVVATDSVTIKAASGDATLNDDITSTGSILIEALLGKASVKGVDADTTASITAQDIDLDGTVNGDTSVVLNATDATKDISGTDINITGGSVETTGRVVATNSATIEATTTDVTLNDDLSSTGSVLIKALLGKVTAAGLSAVTTLEVYAKEIMISGDAVAGGDVTVRASDGDATLSGNTESTGGNVDVEANLGTASVFDVASHLATTITGGAVKVLGDLVSDGQATLQALTGNVDITGSVTANGGLLLLNAAQGDAVINKIASTTNVSIQALDLDLSGSISAGDEVILTSLDSGTTIVLGGDGGVGSFTLRKPQGLTIDAGELGRISAGDLKIDAAGNDALLRSVDFSGATLGDLSIGASNSSWIMTDGIVTGLNSLTLGYVDGLLDRRPELVLIGGSLGVDSASGSDWLGSVVVNSSQDIIVGSQTFKTYYDTIDPTLSQLGSLNSNLVGVASNHIFIATSNLELYAPGDIVQLNTGSGVDGKGLVFKVSAVGKAVLNPSGLGPDKAVLFGVVVRDDGTRVTSFSAGLEPRLLYEGEKDSFGNVISEPLTQTGDYHFNLCVIGDPVSCSNALLRQAEGTTAAALSDPNPNVLASGLTFDTGDDEDDGEDDTSGAAATGNESLWGASTQ